MVNEAINYPVFQFIATENGLIMSKDNENGDQTTIC